MFICPFFWCLMFVLVSKANRTSKMHCGLPNQLSSHYNYYICPLFPFSHELLITFNCALLVVKKDTRSIPLCETCPLLLERSSLHTLSEFLFFPPLHYFIPLRRLGDSNIKLSVYDSKLISINFLLPIMYFHKDIS